MAQQGVKREWTTQDLSDVYENYLHQIASIYDKFDGYMQNQEFAAWAGHVFGGDKEKYKKVMEEKGEYCMTLKTEEEWEKQQERCERILSMGGDLKLPLVIILDPQITSNRVVMKGSYPTFYTTWKNPLFDNGNPGFVVAYPPRVTEMDDEEIRVALAHEFGHIKQKHMFLSKSDPAANDRDLNVAMDYSINWVFNNADLNRYDKLARKMFNGETGATIIPWAPNKGGLGVPYASTHTWREILKLINVLKDKPPEGGPPGPPPPPEPMEVGDIVKRRGEKKYGRIVDIDYKTGELIVEPMSADDLKKAKDELQGK